MPYYDKDNKLHATQEELERARDYGDASPEGIVYTWELAGDFGANYYLFPSKEHTEEELEETKNWLRNSHDVIDIRVGIADGEYPLPYIVSLWTPEQREEGFRKIVNECAFGNVEDCIGVDLFTANYVVQVMDNLNEENKKKFLSYPASHMIAITWRLIKRYREENQ